MTEIACSQPTISRYGVGRFLGRVIITEHHIVTAQLQLAGDAVGQHHVRLIRNYPRLDATRQPRRSVSASACMLRIAEHDGSAFSHTHRLDHANPEHRFERAMLIRWQRRRGGSRETNGRPKPGVAVDSIQQIRNDRGHQIKPGRLVALSPAPPRACRKFVWRDDAAAAHKRRDGRNALPVDVIKRQRRQHAVCAGQAMPIANRASSVQQIAVR